MKNESGVGGHRSLAGTASLGWLSAPRPRLASPGGKFHVGQGKLLFIVRIEDTRSPPTLTGTDGLGLREPLFRHFPPITDSHRITLLLPQLQPPRHPLHLYSLCLLHRLNFSFVFLLLHASIIIAHRIRSPQACHYRCALYHVYDNDQSSSLLVSRVLPTASSGPGDRTRHLGCAVSRRYRTSHISTLCRRHPVAFRGLARTQLTTKVKSCCIWMVHWTPNGKAHNTFIVTSFVFGLYRVAM